MPNPDYSALYQDALTRTQQAAQREQEYRRQDLLRPAQTYDGAPGVATRLAEVARPMAESNRGKR